jgi:hypothetical protein
MQRHIPRPVWAERGEKILVCRLADDSLAGLGLRASDEAFASYAHLPGNYDLAVVRSRSGPKVGIFHHQPGGYVRLEKTDGEVFIFAPDEIEYVARVMHVERDGRIVQFYAPDEIATADGWEGFDPVDNTDRR